MDRTSAVDTASLPRRTASVFLLEDLSAACIPLQIMAKKSGRSRSSITVRPHVMDNSVLLANGNPISRAKLSRCLETLKQIRGADRVKIFGSVDPGYKKSVIASMCDSWNGQKTMDLVEARFDKGDKAALKGHVLEALVEYKAAVHLIRGNCIHVSACNEKLVGGRFDGLWLIWYVFLFSLSCIVLPRTCTIHIQPPASFIHVVMLQELHPYIAVYGIDKDVPLPPPYLHPPSRTP